MHRCYLWVLALLGSVAVAASSRAVEGEHQHVCRYCSGGLPADALGDETVSRKYAPDRQVDVLHIKLDVTPDFNARTIRGTAAIHFQTLSRPLTTLRLDGVDLRVSDVRSSRTIRDYSVGKTEIAIVFRDPIEPGEEAWVEINYSAEPQRGLYFRTAEMGYPEGDDHLWTQGEPHESRHWYPCFDAPNERSSTEVICRVPDGMTVLSNGRKTAETTDRASGQKSVRWIQEKPHANYLICIVAGYLHGVFDEHEGLPLAFYTQPSLAQYAESGFRDTARIMAFYEQEIGVAYPWEKYFQTTIADFMWGGMENTTITTLNQRAVFDDATENVYTNRGLDAHELAHQWFGNYVTCKDWSHLWLNEGFATYYTHLYEGHRFGREALLYGLYRDAENNVLLDRDDPKPIVYRQYDRPSEQFDYRAYPKGSWVLHMLRSRFGDDLYREAIHLYLERHALTHVETEELREAFEDVTGETLDQFFDQWVYHAGHPQLEVSYDWLADEQLAHISVRQTQELSDQVLLFDFDTRLRFVVDGEPLQHPIEISEREHDFYVHLPGEPTVVRFDPDYTVLAKIEFEKSDDLLEAQLKETDDVIGRLRAAEALGERATEASVAALQEAFVGDPFYGVRMKAASALRKIGDDRAFEALRANWEQDDARVRQHDVRQLARFYRPEAENLLLEIAVEEENPAVVAAALAGLDKYAGERVNEALEQALVDEQFRKDRAAAALRAIGRRRNAQFQEAVLETVRRESAVHDPQLIAAGLRTLAKISTRKKHQPKAYQMLADYLDHDRPAVRRAAAAALGTLGDPRARMLLEPLARQTSRRRLAEAAKSALKQLDKKQPAAPQELIELREQLRSLQEDFEELEETVEEIEQKSEAAESSS